MSNSSDRETEYTGNDKERAKHPLTVQEQARAMRRQGIHDRRGETGTSRRQ